MTLRYAEKLEYVDTNTGTAYSDLTEVPAGADLVERAVEYRDVDYTVAALVAVPNALDYGYYGADEFVMGSETFLRDTGTDNIMYYAFNAEEGPATAWRHFCRTTPGTWTPPWTTRARPPSRRSLRASGRCSFCWAAR